MSTLTYPYSFSPNTTIRSSEINANFTAVATLVNTTGLQNNNIASDAAIARTKIASGTASHVLINDGSGVMSSEANLAVTRGGTGVGSITSNGILYGQGTSAMVATGAGSQYQVFQAGASGVPTFGAVQLAQSAAVSGTLAIANGGTGQATANAAFGALSPLTTKGDLVAYSTVNARLAVGTDGQVLTADSAQTLGVKWAASPSAPTASDGINNLGLSTSVASNALTVNLTQSDGSSNPSSGSPVYISFRNSTLTVGSYTQRQVTSALSITTPSSGATLGFTNPSGYNYIYVYAIDNAGTVELALAGSKNFDEGTRYSTTVLDTSSSSLNVLYSTTARTNVAIRLIGRLKQTQATPGVYIDSMLETSLLPLQISRSPRSEVWVTTQNGYGSTNTKIVKWTNVSRNIGSAISYTSSSTNGDSFTIVEDGIYSINMVDGLAAGGNPIGISLNSSQLTTSVASITATNRISTQLVNINTGWEHCGITLFLQAGDVVRGHSSAADWASNQSQGFFRITKVSD